MTKAEKKEKKTALKAPAPKSILVEETVAAGGKVRAKPGKELAQAVLKATATANFLRISPRKAKLVIDEIRGLGANEALAKLRLINKKASRLVGKLVNAALTNAEHNFKLKKENLYIKEIRADQGPTLKRFKPAAFGIAHSIKKRTAHLTVTLAVKEVKENLKNKLIKKNKLVKRLEKKDKEGIL